MTIRELRHVVGMSQQKFANYFGIPVGTLRNWEQGIAKPPEYVFDMISHSLRRDKMINIETIKFVRMLDDLAERSIRGIEEFSNATNNALHEKIFFAKSYNYKVVLDACVIDEKDYYHHDIVSFYENNEYVITAHFDEDDNHPYLVVDLFNSNEQIVINGGEWYFV